MLAQNFKTPAELGITDAEFNALETVLRMMERGEIKPAPKDACFGLLTGHETPTMFRMAGVTGYANCGTACCILGWARHIANGSVGLGYPDSHSTHELFYPSGDTEAILCRDPEKGAIALRNYLTHGEPRWAEALAA